MTDPLPDTGPAVAIAATFTVEPILPALRFLLSEAGLDLEVKFAPYNQVFQNCFRVAAARYQRPWDQCNPGPD